MKFASTFQDTHCLEGPEICSGQGSESYSEWFEMKRGQTKGPSSTNQFPT